MEKEAGRTVLLFYLWTKMYDRERSRKSCPSVLSVYNNVWWKRKQEELSLCSICVKWCMMEKEAGRAFSLYYLCTVMYDGEGSRKSSLSLFYLCTIVYDREGSRKTCPSVLFVYNSVWWRRKQEELSLSSICVQWCMMEKGAGRALPVFYLCTVMYDGEGSRRSSSLIYLCKNNVWWRRKQEELSLCSICGKIMYDGEGSRESSHSVLSIRDPVPFWPLDPGSRIGFSGSWIPDLGSLTHIF